MMKSVFIQQISDFKLKQQFVCEKGYRILRHSDYGAGRRPNASAGTAFAPGLDADPIEYVFRLVKFVFSFLLFLIFSSFFSTDTIRLWPMDGFANVHTIRSFRSMHSSLKSASTLRLSFVKAFSIPPTNIIAFDTLISFIISRTIRWAWWNRLSRIQAFVRADSSNVAKFLNLLMAGRITGKISTSVSISVSFFRLRNAFQIIKLYTGIK